MTSLSTSIMGPIEKVVYQYIYSLLSSSPTVLEYWNTAFYYYEIYISAYIPQTVTTIGLVVYIVVLIVLAVIWSFLPNSYQLLVIGQGPGYKANSPYPN